MTKVRPRRMVYVLVTWGMLLASLLAIPPASATTFPFNARVNDWTLGAQVNPAVAVASDGSIHVVWEDYRAGPNDPDIYYAKSVDGGQTFSPSVPVNDNGGTGSKQKYPSVAVSSDGRVHVVWTDMRQLPGPLDDRIYYAWSDNPTFGFSQNVPISDGSGDWNDFVEVLQPRIVYEGHGNGCYLHVVWSGPGVVTLPEGPYGVWYDNSTDCGSTFGLDLQLATAAWDASMSTVWNETAWAVGVASVEHTPGPLNGFSNVVVNWTDDGVWHALQVNDVPGVNGNFDSSLALRFGPVAYAPDGRGSATYLAHVAWSDGRNADPNDPLRRYDWDIYYTRELLAVGQPAADPDRRVNTDATWAEQSEPWIVVDAFEDPKIAWTDWRHDLQGHYDPEGFPGSQNSDIYFVESFDGGGTFEDNQRTNNDDPVGSKEQSRPSSSQFATSTDAQSGIYVVWQDERLATSDLNVYVAGWWDSDGDALSDWEETTGYYDHFDGCNYATDPGDADTDNDGIKDGVEAGARPADADPTTWTCPTDADTDDDGVYDGKEDKNQNGMREGNTPGDSDSDWAGGFGPGEPDPREWDTDGDGLSDGQETGLAYPMGYTSYAEWLADPNSATGAAFRPDADAATRTDPIDTDTDDDGMPDGWIDLDNDGTKDPMEFEDRDLDGFVDPGDWNAGQGPGETDPGTFDTDADGLTDREEIDEWNTDPTDPDTDADMIPDGWELASDPLDADTDDDGLLDGIEDRNRNGIRGGNDPRSGDSDWNGGLGPGETSPIVWDTDGDGLSDGQEAGLSTPQSSDTDVAKFKADADSGATKTDPLSPDSDGDGLVDGFVDTDSDGIKDLGEYEDRDLDGVRDPGAWNGGAGPGETDPNLADSDNDELTDRDEQFGSPPTDPTNSDTDGGTVPDGWEVSHGLDPDDNPGDDIADADGDGLTNYQEFLLGTLPDDSDTDDDFIADGADPNPLLYNIDDAPGNTIRPDVVYVDSTCRVSVAIDYFVPMGALPAVTCSNPPSGSLQGVVGEKIHVETTAQVPFLAVVKVLYDDALFTEEQEGKFLLYFHTGGKWTLPIHDGLEEATWRSPENNYVWMEAHHLGDFWIADSTANDLDSDGVSDGKELNVDEYESQTIQVLAEGNNVDFNSDVVVHVTVPVAQNAQEVVEPSLSYITLTGLPEWSPSYRITSTSEQDIGPDIVVDGSNVAHIVWYQSVTTDLDLLMYVKVDRIGNVLRSRQFSWSGCHGYLNPRVDIDSSQNLHIVLDCDGLVFYQKLDNNGDILVSPKSIAWRDSYFPNGHDVAVGPNGKVHVVWDEWLDSDHGSEIYYLRLDNVGDPETAEVRVTDTGDNEDRPRIGVDSAGGAHIVYHTNERDTGIYDLVFHRKVTGTEVSPPHLVSSDDDTSSLKPEISVGVDGNVYVVWDDGEFSGWFQILFRRLDNSGQSTTPIVQVSNSYGARATVSTDTLNRVNVVWDYYGVYWSRLSSSGVTLVDDQLLVSDPFVWMGGVESDSSNFVYLAWTGTADTDLYFKNDAGYPLNPSATFYSSPDEEGQAQTPNWVCSCIFAGSQTLTDSNTQANGNPPMTTEMTDYLDAYQSQNPAATEVPVPIRLHSDQVGRMTVVPYVVVIPLVTDPLQDDVDADYLADSDESSWGTVVENPDTDGDGLKDGLEVWWYGSSPTDPNSDSTSPCSDTLLDGWVENNPPNQRWDAGEQPGEWNYQTSPLSGDTDGDGICDDEEVLLFGPDVGRVDNPVDADGDGLWNGPTDFDSDADTLDDREELIVGWTVRVDLEGDEGWIGPGEEYLIYPDPSLADSDGDLLSDHREMTLGTDPTETDTDKDGLADTEAEQLWNEGLRLFHGGLGVHAHPSDSFTFGHATKAIALTQTHDDGNLKVWEATLLPGQFDLADFSVRRDWTVSGDCPSCFTEPSGTFYLVGINTREVLSSTIEVTERRSRTDWIGRVSFAIHARTNPLAVDTDLDGVSDGSEVLQQNRKLPGNPVVDLDFDNDAVSDANPVTPDLFVELDWMASTGWLDAAHTPSSDVLSKAARLFRTQGIGFHTLLDDEVPHDEHLTDAEWLDYYNTHFSDDHIGIFRHALYAHAEDGEGDWFGACGEAYAPSDMTVVYDAAWFCSEWEVFMQELGHSFLGEIDDSSIWLSADDHYHTNIACDIMSASYVWCWGDADNYSDQIWRQMMLQTEFGRGWGIGLGL